MTPSAGVTVITGGTGGIGLAVARAVLARDPEARCVLADLEPTGAGLPNERMSFLPCDVRDPAQVDSCARKSDELGPIVGLVNCAGILAGHCDTVDLELAELRTMFAIHLEGTLLWCQAAARSWLHRGRSGAIVNVSSVAAKFGWPGRAPYGAAKAAVESLTRTLAVEWAEHGIRVNAVAPGYVAASMMADSQRPAGIATLDEVAPRHALGRVAEPEEIAAAIVFLLSEAASFITGEVLLVDGGFRAKKG